MQMMRYLLGLGSLLLVVGCKEAWDVCSSGEYRLTASTASPAMEDYCSYKKSLDSPGPPLGRLAEPLGRHGREAVAIWILDMETGKGMYKNWQFGPILLHARDSRGFRLCTDPALMKKARDGLRKYYSNLSDKSVRSMLTPYC